MTEQKDKILKLPTVIEDVTLSRSSIYQKMKAGQFPRSIKLGVRAVGWRASDIQKWIQEQPINGGTEE